MKELVLILMLVIISVNADNMWSIDSGSAYSDILNKTQATSNKTLTCAARNIQGPVELPFPPIVPLVIRCLLIFYYMVVTFCGILLNSFVVFLVWKFKTLRNLEFALACQIVVFNLIGSAFVAPLSLISAISNEWLLATPMCIITGSVYYAITSLRALFMLGFVTDRFFNVFMSLAYPKYRNKVLCVGFVGIYLLSSMFLVLPASLDCIAFSASAWICRVTSSCSIRCSIIRQVLGLGVLLPCTVVPLFLYGALFCKAKRIKRDINELPLSDQMERKRWRATVTFFLMFLALFAVRTPAGTLNGIIVNNIARALDAQNTLWFYVVDACTLNMFYLSYIMDPMFILRNSDVKEVIPSLTWLPSYWY